MKRLNFCKISVLTEPPHTHRPAAGRLESAPPGVENVHLNLKSTIYAEHALNPQSTRSNQRPSKRQPYKCIVPGPRHRRSAPSYSNGPRVTRLVRFGNCCIISRQCPSLVYSNPHLNPQPMKIPSRAENSPENEPKGV